MSIENVLRKVNWKWKIHPECDQYPSPGWGPGLTKNDKAWWAPASISLLPGCRHNGTNCLILLLPHFSLSADLHSQTVSRNKCSTRKLHLSNILSQQQIWQTEFAYKGVHMFQMNSPKLVRRWLAAVRNRCKEKKELPVPHETHRYKKRPQYKSHTLPPSFCRPTKRGMEKPMPHPVSNLLLLWILLELQFLADFTGQIHRSMVPGWRNPSQSDFSDTQKEQSLRVRLKEQVRNVLCILLYVVVWM